MLVYGRSNCCFVHGYLANIVMDTFRAQTWYGLICFVSVLAMSSATVVPWCGQYTPVLKICQQGSLQNVTKVFFDTAGIPLFQASKCTCNVTRVDRGFIDPFFNLSVLNNSYMQNNMRFRFKNIVLNQTHIKNSTHGNDEELWFIKSDTSNNGGACLLITSEVHMNIECKPQRIISTENSTGNHSTVSVTQANHVTRQMTEDVKTVSVTQANYVTHHMPEDVITISGIALPIGTGLAVLVIVLSVILILIVRKRRRRHHQHSDKDTTNNEAVEDDSVDHAVNPKHHHMDEVDMKSKDEYEYVDNVGGLLNATGADSAPNVAGSVNDYDYTMCNEVSSYYGIKADDPICQSDSTYDRVQSTRPQPTHMHTDNIYNKFQDTILLDNDTYDSTNATPNFKIKTLSSKPDEDYSLMEIK